MASTSYQIAQGLQTGLLNRSFSNMRQSRGWKYKEQRALASILQSYVTYQTLHPIVSHKFSKHTPKWFTAVAVITPAITYIVREIGEKNGSLTYLNNADRIEKGIDLLHQVAIASSAIYYLHIGMNAYGLSVLASLVATQLEQNASSCPQFVSIAISILNSLTNAAFLLSAPKLMKFSALATINSATEAYSITQHRKSQARAYKFLERKIFEKVRDPKTNEAIRQSLFAFKNQLDQFRFSNSAGSHRIFENTDTVRAVQSIRTTNRLYLGQMRTFASQAVEKAFVDLSLENLLNEIKSGGVVNVLDEPLECLTDIDIHFLFGPRFSLKAEDIDPSHMVSPLQEEMKDAGNIDIRDMQTMWDSIHWEDEDILQEFYPTLLATAASRKITYFDTFHQRMDEFKGIFTDGLSLLERKALENRQTAVIQNFYQILQGKLTDNNSMTRQRAFNVLCRLGALGHQGLDIAAVIDRAVRFEEAASLGITRDALTRDNHGANRLSDLSRQCNVHTKGKDSNKVDALQIFFKLRTPLLGTNKRRATIIAYDNLITDYKTMKDYMRDGLNKLIRTIRGQIDAYHVGVDTEKLLALTKICTKKIQAEFDTIATERDPNEKAIKTTHIMQLLCEMGQVGHVCATGHSGDIAQNLASISGKVENMQKALQEILANHRSGPVFKAAVMQTYNNRTLGLQHGYQLNPQGQHGEANWVYIAGVTFGLNQFHDEIVRLRNMSQVRKVLKENFMKEYVSELLLTVRQAIATETKPEAPLHFEAVSEWAMNMHPYVQAAEKLFGEGNDASTDDKALKKVLHPDGENGGRANFQFQQTFISTIKMFVKTQIFLFDEIKWQELYEKFIVHTQSLESLSYDLHSCWFYASAIQQIQMEKENLSREINESEQANKFKQKVAPYQVQKTNAGYILELLQLEKNIAEGNIDGIVDQLDYLPYGIFTIDQNRDKKEQIQEQIQQKTELLEKIREKKQQIWTTITTELKELGITETFEQLTKENAQRIEKLMSLYGATAMLQSLRIDLTDPSKKAQKRMVEMQITQREKTIGKLIDELKIPEPPTIPLFSKKELDAKHKAQQEIVGKERALKKWVAAKGIDVSNQAFTNFLEFTKQIDKVVAELYQEQYKKLLKELNHESIKVKVVVVADENTQKNVHQNSARSETHKRYKDQNIHVLRLDEVVDLYGMDMEIPYTNVPPDIREQVQQNGEVELELHKKIETLDDFVGREDKQIRSRGLVKTKFDMPNDRLAAMLLIGNRQLKQRVAEDYALGENGELYDNDLHLY